MKLSLPIIIIITIIFLVVLIITTNIIPGFEQSSTPTYTNNVFSETNTNTETRQETIMSRTRSLRGGEEQLTDVFLVGANYNIEPKIYLKKITNTSAYLRIVVTIRTEQDTFIYVKKIAVDNLTPSEPLYYNLTKNIEKPLGGGTSEEFVLEAYINDPELITKWEIGTQHTVSVTLIVQYEEKTEVYLVPVEEYRETTTPKTYVKK